MPFFSRLLASAAPLALAASAVHADVVISSNATLNVSCSAGVCSPTAANAVLNVTDLENMLASGNVDVTTTGSGVQADNIEVQSPFSWSSSNSLTLDAYQSVGVAGAVAVQGSGGVSLMTDDGGSGGLLSFSQGGNLTFARTTNTLSINRQSYILEENVKALAAAISKNPSGFFALSKSGKAGRAYKGAPIAATFSGTLNGLGNAIKGLKINVAKGNPSENIGLFAELGSGGAINSVQVLDATINVVERNRDSDSIGVMAGASYGNLTNDYTSGTISVTVKYFSTAGGLVGSVAGNVVLSSSSVSLELDDPEDEQSIGIVGGLVGYGGTVEMSFASGSVQTTRVAAVEAGGLVGDGGTIENSYATGSVAVTEAETGASEAGGLMGLDGVSLPTTSSYSTGTASAGQGNYTGGFVGYDLDNGDLSDDYWDTTTSGLTQGAGNISNDPGITGETTQQLQSGLPSGFDPSIWAEDSNINNGFPYLIANPPRN